MVAAIARTGMQMALRGGMFNTAVRVTAALSFLDLIIGYFNGQSRGGAGDFFGRLFLGGAYDEARPDNPLVQERGKLTGSAAMVLREAFLRRVAMLIPGAALPIVGGELYSAFREFRMRDGDGIFDIAAGINDLSNAGAVLMSLPLFRFVVPAIAKVRQLTKQLRHLKRMRANPAKKLSRSQRAKMDKKIAKAEKKIAQAERESETIFDESLSPTTKAVGGVVIKPLARTLSMAI